MSKKYLFLFVAAILGVLLIGIVSAELPWCCEKMKDTGAICIPINEEQASSCEEDSLKTESCATVEYCNLGTCVDEENGICSARSPKLKCESEGGEWDDDLLENVRDCDWGCCTLEEGRKHFRTRMHCTNEGGNNFDTEESERECISNSINGMGACVYDDGDCEFIMTNYCSGSPYLGVLCSNPELETNCPGIPEEIKTTCYNNKVYFLDDCGEIANVYDNAKKGNLTYWKSVQEPDCIVDLSDANSQKTCGNCNDLESVCSEGDAQEGNYICEDLNCIDKDDENKIRKNKESWCVYEKGAGNSRDVAGSSHVLKWCDEGKIKSKPCGSNREEVCAESLEDDGITYKAQCRANEGYKCSEAKMKSYTYNNNGYLVNDFNNDWVVDVGVYEEIDGEMILIENINACEDISEDCRLESVDLYDETNTGEGGRDYFGGEGKTWEWAYKPVDNFKFDVCVPKYPIGDSKGCSTMNDIDCTTYWVWEGATKAWNCKGNCECLDPTYYYNWQGKTSYQSECKKRGGECFGTKDYDEVESYADQMNKVCISLGDCGGYYNTENEYDEGFDTFEIDDLTALRGIHLWNWATLGEKYKFFLIEKMPFYRWRDATGNWVWHLYWGGYQNWAEGDMNPREFEASGDLREDKPERVSGTKPVFLEEEPLIGSMGGTLKGYEEDLSWRWWVKKQKEEVDFTCQAWQPPSGGDDCTKCNNGEFPCTKYRCKFLGESCGILKNFYVENGVEETYETEKLICINEGSGDNTPPEITFEEIKDYDNESITNGQKIRDSSKCIQEHSSIEFALGTNEYSKCVYNLESVDEPNEENDNELEGTYFNHGSNSYSINHAFEGTLPSVDESLPGISGEKEEEINIYVRCMDYAGNFKSEEYVINFCIKQGPDKDYATILEFDPEDESFLKYEANSSYVKIFLNEPAECVWTTGSWTENKSFTSCDLNYKFGEVDQDLSCSTTISNLTEPTNKIYIKCKDQPWICNPDDNENETCCDDIREEGKAWEEGKTPPQTEDESSCCCYKGPWKEEHRNENNQGFVYTLYATENPLNITSISPQGDIIGSGARRIDLEVTTSGGIDNGVSICEYKFYIESVNMTTSGSFSSVGSEYHKKSLNLPKGKYNVSVNCYDEIENHAEGNIIFDLKIDEDAPKIVRAYKEAGVLRIITNEEAKCYSSIEGCFSNLEDEDSMTSVGFSTKHSVKWTSGATYYIKCEDKNGIENYDCVKIILSI